jgi:hypothetical protein
MLNFRRITTQKRFIPQIDGLRFVAIASVVFFHIYSALEGRGAIPPPIPLNLDLAKRGVELFFAISGFILGVPFASHFLLKAPESQPEAVFPAPAHPPGAALLPLFPRLGADAVNRHSPSLQRHGAAPARSLLLPA